MDWDALILSLIGKPFRWNGRGPDAYDCWGLVLEGLRRMKIPAPTQEYVVSDGAFACVSGEATRQMQEAADSSLWQMTNSLEPGDVVAMSTKKRLSHVGLMTPHGVLHTSLYFGAVVQPLPQLKASGYQRIEGYRWVG